MKKTLYQRACAIVAAVWELLLRYLLLLRLLDGEWAEAQWFSGDFLVKKHDNKNTPKTPDNHQKTTWEIPVGCESQWSLGRSFCTG